MKDFRQLKVWEGAHELVLALYQTTASFPRDETYGLTAQIHRSASSTPSNISGRLWARWGCWVSPLLSDRPWFRQRVGIPDSARSRPKADPIRPIWGTVSSNYRNQADADGVGSEADHWSLKADSARPAESSTLVAATGRAGKDKRGCRRGSSRGRSLEMQVVVTQGPADDFYGRGHPSWWRGIRTVCCATNLNQWSPGIPI